ncbi:hypothetical protein E4U55_003989 [Claviceps digitariae]|nr:hypothetical protein E4U55_003989 [Claviceps digitariae]
MTVFGTEDWRILVAKKREQVDSQIPMAWRLDNALLASSLDNGKLLEADIPRRSRILSQQEIEITEQYSAEQLLRKLAQAEMTSLAVTTAFCKRAAIAQQLTSCLTEHFFDRALARARYLDEYLSQEGKPMGPLHGLPISIKDSFCVEGVQSTLGYVAFLKKPAATANSALVNMLLDLGAVLYTKTNLSQMMMTADSENNIFGRTLNPNNTKLTAGGSSGGEGALVALRGSILGVGTDIAGSVRIPAQCNGIYAFKPTADRVPFSGQVSPVSMDGLPGLTPVAGPLAHSIADLRLFMMTVLDARPNRYDITAHTGPWQKQPTPGPLTIGLVCEDENFPLHPPVRRAMDSAVEALAAAGHSVVRLPNSADRSISYGNRLAYQYIVSAPQVDYLAASGEPPVNSVSHRYHPMFTGPFPVPQELEPFEKMNALHMAVQRYQEAWRRAWVDNAIDVFLAPAAQNTAVAHDTYGWPPYTVLWNLLDYPACVIPYGRASKALDPEPMSMKDDVQPDCKFEKPLQSCYHQPFLFLGQCIREELENEQELLAYTSLFHPHVDDPDAVDGAPCTLQIIAPRFLDEVCLASAATIEEDLRKAKPWWC